MLGTIIPLFPGVPGGPELIVILLIAILLFGANKIPELARSSGQAIGEFQKGRQQIEEELQEMQEGGADTEESEPAADTAAGGTVETEPEPETETETETDRSSAQE